MRPEWRAWGQFENNLYTSYGYNLIQVGPDLSGSEVGPEKLVNNDSAVRGRISSFAAVGTMFALAGLYNPDTNTGYLMKFGGYATQDGETKHLDAWHGSISVPFVNQTVQALFVSSIGAPTGHTYVCGTE